MLDFSLARHCWLAALWAAQSLQSNVQAAPATGDAPDMPDVAEALVLRPALAVYGEDRVMPVLVSPVYDWLIKSLCAVMHSIGAYHKVDVATLGDLQKMLMGQQPWRANFFANIDTSEKAASDGLRLLSVEWDWVQYYWRDQGDSVSGLVHDFLTIQQSLPLMGRSPPVGGEGRVVGAQSDLAPHSRRSPSNSTISVQQMPAWHPVFVEARVALMSGLLAALGDRWAEL